MRCGIGTLKATSSAVCAWVGQIATRFPEPAIVTCFLHQRLRSRSGRGPAHRVGGRDLVRRRGWRQRWRRVCHSNISKNDRDCTRTKTWITLVPVSGRRIQPWPCGCRLMAIQQAPDCPKISGETLEQKGQNGASEISPWFLQPDRPAMPLGATTQCLSRPSPTQHPLALADACQSMATVHLDLVGTCRGALLPCCCCILS